LVPRTEPGAVIHDEALAARRIADLLAGRAIVARDGSELRLPIDTVCLHGDSPGAAVFARKLAEALRALGIGIAGRGADG
jgi:UPF0271 protein